MSTPVSGVPEEAGVAKPKSQVVTLSSVSTTDEERTKTGIKRIRQSIRRGNRTRFPRISRRGSRNRKVHIIASGVPETGGQAEEGALHFR